MSAHDDDRGMGEEPSTGGRKRPMVLSLPKIRSSAELQEEQDRKRRRLHKNDLFALLSEEEGEEEMEDKSTVPRGPSVCSLPWLGMALELQAHILRYLDTEDLLKCMTVCKKWRREVQAMDWQWHERYKKEFGVDRCHIKAMSRLSDESNSAWYSQYMNTFMALKVRLLGLMGRSSDENVWGQVLQRNAMMDLMFWTCEKGSPSLLRHLLSNCIPISLLPHSHPGRLCAGGTVVLPLSLPFHEVISQVRRAGSTRHLTVLGMAVTHRNLEVCKVLLEVCSPYHLHNADVERRRSALWLAAEVGDQDICELLIAHGVNIHLADVNDSSPLFIACESGHADIVRLLLQHGAEADRPDSLQRTPLLVAAANGRKECVSVLLFECSQKVNIYARDYKGRTPMSACAHIRGFDAVWRMMMIKVDGDGTEEEESKPARALPGLFPNMWTCALCSLLNSQSVEECTVCCAPRDPTQQKGIVEVLLEGQEIGYRESKSRT